MKSLAHPSFFRAFDLLIGLTNPALKRSHWIHDGVEFERERHSVMGPRHGFVIEITTLTRPGRRGWSLMVTKEYWWAGPDAKPFKNLRWARPLGGERSDLFAWLRAQESALERSLSLEMENLHAKASTNSAHTEDHEPASAGWLDDECDHE